MKKNYDNWLKNKKVIQSKNVKKMPKKLKMSCLNIHKGAGIFENSQNLCK